MMGRLGQLIERFRTLPSRDPARIDPTLELVRAYWKRYPDLRLGQIVENMCCMAGQRDTFYVEDDVIREQLALALTER